MATVIPGAVQVVWPAFPTIEQFKEWARIAGDDTVDDAAISEKMAAAQADMYATLTPTDPITNRPLTDLPGNLREAFYLRVMRLLARRNSPEGVVGFADFGPARVARADVDVDTLEGPYRRIATVLA